MAKTARPEMRKWAKIGVGAVSLALLVVWEHQQARIFARAVQAKQKEADRLTYDNARMRLQIHQYISPSHLDLLARKELGMAPVEPKRIIGVENP